MSPHSFHLRRSALVLPILAMIVVVFGAYFFHATLTLVSGLPWQQKHIDVRNVAMDPNITLRIASAPRDSLEAASDSVHIQADRVSQRTGWTSALAIYAAVCAGVILTAACVIYASLEGFDYSWRVVGMIGAPVVSMVILAPLAARALPTSLMSQIVDQTVRIHVPEINDIITTVDTLTLAAAINLTCACTAMLILPKGTIDLDTLDARYMTKMMKLLRVTLYAGTLALVLAVMEKSALAHWAISYVRDPKEREALETLTASLTTARGVYYSLALLAIYLPTTMILRRQAEAVLESEPEEGEDPDYREWLVKEGLGFSVGQLLPKVVAILGPLLAGPIAELVKRIGSGG